MNNLENLLNEATLLFDSIDNISDLEQAKARYLGKSGALTEILKGLKNLSPEERPIMGGQINKLKEALENRLNYRRELILSKKMEEQLAGEALDVTLPGRGAGMGGLHPITKTLERIETLFSSMGFAVASGPEIETDIILLLLISRKIIPHERCMIHSILLKKRISICCVPIHLRFRSVTCRIKIHLSG